MSDHQKVNVVGGVLISNKKFILTQRASNLKNYPNYYEFPGGKVEPGECCIKALQRELSEELSITVSEHNMISFPSNTLENQDLILTLFIVTKWNNNIILNPEIHSNLIEIEKKDLINFENLLENDKLLIQPILDYLIDK